MSAALLAEATKPFHQKLLHEARTSLASKMNEMAVVLAQAASEMCTEWAISALFAMRGDDDLAEPILRLFLVKDICSDRVRSVYSALSGDNPNQEPFWERLKSHRERRHAVVHRGAKSSDSEAAESVAVVEAYVIHVEAVLSGLQAEQTQKS